MSGNADKDLVQQAKQGELSAITELYRRYWRAARASAFGVTGDLSLAEDAASEALCAAFDGLDDLRDTQRFGPWLHTIVIRTTRRLMTDRSKKKKAELKWQPDKEFSDPSITLEQREIVALIHEAVGNLSQTLREAISLFYFEGYSVEEAAGFLNVPAGTFKRRLHDGRGRLNNVAEQIIKGKKPMNLKREQILQQFKELIDKGRDSMDSQQILRKVLQLRPLPYDLMSKFLKRHSNTSKKMATSEGRKDLKRRSRKLMEYYCQSSRRALDPDHPIGAVAQAIREALPEFKEWQIDVSQAAHNIVQALSGNFKSLNWPPGFAEGKSESYVYAVRSGLCQSHDGSMYTMYELMQNKDDKDLSDADIITNGRLSDSLVLMWMRADNITLHDVEDLLSRLSEVIAPKVEVCFLNLNEPGFRTALRMQFVNIPIPAAIGGPLEPRPNMPEGVSVACVRIFLESWAAAQTGQVVELAKLSVLLDLIQNKK